MGNKETRDAGHDTGWSALDDLLTRLQGTRRDIAALQAAEAGLFAEAIDLVLDRMEQRRLQGERASDADLPLREVSLELGMALRVSDRTVQARLGDAHSLVTRFSATHTAWAEGRIDAGHAWSIARVGVSIGDDTLRATYEARALEVALTESPSRMTTAARAIAATVAPDDFADRTRSAVEDRQVRVYDLDDGLARLIADLPAALAYGIRDRLTQLATVALAATSEDDEPDEPDVSAEPGGLGGLGATGEFDATGGLDAPGEPHALDEAGTPAEAGPLGGAGGADGAGAPGAPGANRLSGTVTTVTTGPSPHRATGDPSVDTRTLDQARADVLADLLLAGTPAVLGDAAAAITGHVHITVPARTLATGDVATGPALLAGHGPIDTDTARHLADLAPAWTRVFTDPATGLPLAVDRYRPSAELRRFLRARDERCRTPGCTRSAVRSDIDHTRDAAHGGETTADNLAHLCRRHHVAKHRTAWRVRQRPGGVLEWTGPTGRTHRDRPPATVRFTPAGAPSPPPVALSCDDVGDAPPF
ncbi:HNH endonuclease signature motif containing protein [Microbacterium sp. No. 7]|uniref:HNH endonuclease signature motif containing protein n=1 Tax=Microbacterium sp. No. 7 TaxID=1714373 RepID=UPI0006D1B8F8|nr:HNH endonuclease signature motif containing protein [Microbacterium sp. No. 7]ALJ21646.1 hypothetical protein AOA12_17805 [Microbacterium sp. No. 7]